jgi:hypothetical protein
MKTVERRYQRYFASRPAIPFAIKDLDGVETVLGAGAPAFTIYVNDARGQRALLWGSAASFDTGLVQAYRWVLKAQ